MKTGTTIRGRRIAANRKFWKLNGPGKIHEIFDAGLTWDDDRKKFLLIGSGRIKPGFDHPTLRSTRHSLAATAQPLAPAL